MILADKSPDLVVLFKLFRAIRRDTALAARVAHFIHSLSTQLYPSSKESIGEFAIGQSIFQVDIADRFGLSCFYNSGQELTELEIFSALQAPNSIIWDIGANFGLYSVICATKLNHEGKIYAVEPHRHAVKLLQQNIARNLLANRVTVVEGAVSDEDGLASFFESQEAAFSGLSDTGRAEVEAVRQVKTWRLDTLWQQTGKHAIDLLKIDVEGYEGAVLKGAFSCLENSPNAIIQLEFSSKNLNDERKDQLNASLKELEERHWRIWRTPNNDKFLQPVSSEELFATPEELSGNIFVVQADTNREATLLSAAQEVLSRNASPPSFSTEEISRILNLLLKRVDITEAQLRSELQTEKQIRQEIDEKIRSLRSLSELFSTTPLVSNNSAPLLTLRDLRPEVLARISSLSVILRFKRDGTNLEAALDRVKDLCGSWPYQLTVADCRDKPATFLTSKRAFIVSPGTETEADHPTNRRAPIAVRAALAASYGSHVLLLDADDIPSPHLLESSHSLWRAESSTGLLIAGIAFPSCHPGDQGRSSRHERTVGDMLVLRRGLIARNALLYVGLPSEIEQTGTSFEADLSLRLWHGGFDIAGAPPGAFLESPLPQLGSNSEEDLMLLTERWRGIFGHPLAVAYFNKPSA